MHDNGVSPFKYQGKTIKVKATNLLEFSKKNPNALDEATLSEVKFSALQVKRGTAKEGVTQAEDRVILVLTDESGNDLYFDKDGNISDIVNGSLVYQVMRDIRLTSEGYRITDIYGIEDQIASVETVAQETYQKEIDGDYNTYLNNLK